MSHSRLFGSLQFLARVAKLCDAQGMPSREGLELVRAQQRRAREFDASRRRFLASAGAGAAAYGLAGRRAFAKPAGQVDVDIVVVGAGLGGLAAAYHMQNQGVRSVVYEAAPQLAGRCSSDTTSLGQTIELGGEFINTGHSTMRGYANEFGFAVENLVNDDGHETFFVGGQTVDEAVIVDEYRDLSFRMSKDKTEISNGPTAEWSSKRDVEFDYMTMAEYLDSRDAGANLRRILDVGYVVEYGREIDQQSALNLLFFAHDDRRSKYKPLGQFSDEKYHVIGGNQQIPRAIADSLVEPVRYGHTLVAVYRMASGRYRLTFATGGGGLVDVMADAVVLGIPFTVLRFVDFGPGVLPDWKADIIDTLQYGTNSKLMVKFDRRTWLLDHHANGLATIDRPDLHMTWESGLASASNGEGVLTDFAGGVLGATQNPNDSAYEAERFLAAAEHVFPGVADDARRINGALAHAFAHWPSNPLAGGSYVCSHPGYFTTMEGLVGRRVDNLFFCGEHADSFYEWQGFMEGAANAGIAAAVELVHDLKSQVIVAP